MNRRRFIQSLVAVFSLPAGASIPLHSATAALPAAAAVPTKARFWAIYMSSLHGECTPQTLQSVLNIPNIDAKRYLSQLVSDGIIKPNPLLKESVSQVIKSKDENLFDNIKKRSEMKTQSGSSKIEISEAADTSNDLETETEITQDFLEDEFDVLPEDDGLESEHCENETSDDETTNQT